ncbi:hypothetical protein [Cupriavidus pauculus]|uniref:RelA/SpoT domain-containing protein n=1 Tax=Cupriavidus pauculus TaxID=82633 RepID=A0A3G8H072_9BURK|nr:hypothetical protein [Cupriavidus pauculus]AZG13827.1 hypothetical protein EHF44_10420 [Cupriavidus pauculus]
MFTLSKDEFLARNRISEEKWIKSGCTWNELKAIADHYLAGQKDLTTSAEMFASMMQRIKPVHSVRFRVKNVEHLLEKIVRKRADKRPQKKYQTISVDDYQEVVTDLVGIRALHLFKADCFSIDKEIRAGWRLKEKPVAYVRQGDPVEFREQLRNHGFKIKEHDAGYRSVHYVASTRPGIRDIPVEIQVRTIFEEGWSEIDHEVRYPNFLNDPMIEYFLGIFNRISGAADEMGSFVRKLTASMETGEERLKLARLERDAAMEDVRQALSEAQQERELSGTLRNSLAKAEKELKRLRENSEVVDNLSEDTPTRRLWRERSAYLSQLKASLSPPPLFSSQLDGKQESE